MLKQIPIIISFFLFLILIATVATVAFYFVEILNILTTFVY